jgi:hypothetical protein
MLPQVNVLTCLESISPPRKQVKKEEEQSEEIGMPYRKDPVRKLTPLEGIAGKEVKKDENDVGMAGESKGNSLKKVAKVKGLPTKASLGKLEGEEVQVLFCKLTC